MLFPQTSLIRLIFRNLYNVCIILLLCSYPFISHSQISGKILNEFGSPLPFSTVYIDGTTFGVVSNEEGLYEISPPSEGSFVLVFQYLGYQKKSQKVTYIGKPIKLNVSLDLDINLTGEVVISADREDPAYAIIRQAIRKRPYYKKLIQSYETDLYVKGNIKVLKAPDQIFGSRVGSLDGVLDSTGQGIIYLSESRSKFYFQAPDKKKEIMYASVSSGNENIFRANQFSLAGFDFYNNYLNFGRSIVSPISDNALDFYTYKLEQANVDQSGMIINKISVSPKSPNKPLVNGYIYITDGLWNINSLDIFFTGNALKSTFPDTIRIKQIYLPVEKPDIYCLFTQTINFNAGLLGFKLDGNFSYIFSEYKINHDLSEIFNNKELFKVTQDALNNDSLFWDAKRPIPLTDDEIDDYRKKDSLKIIWNSRSYMDSTDRQDNKPKWSDILFGYTWNNSYKRIKYSYDSPLSTVRFNAVEGLKLNFDSKLEISDSLLRRLTINPVLEYGFADKKIKPRLEMNYRYNNIMAGNINLKAGRQYVQFDKASPITERNNSWNTLLYKVNRMRILQQDFIGMEWRQEVVNSLYVTVKGEYVQRSPLSVNTHYSFFEREKLFAENIPRKDISPEAYNANSYIFAAVRLRWRPGQTYSTYPNQRIRRNTTWPEFNMEYERGITSTQGFSNFNKIKLSIKDNYVTTNMTGYFRYNVESGFFPDNRPQYFADYFHPSANELIMPIDPDFTVFNLMPYYSYSTDQYYISAHFRHHFNGYLFDRIPLIKNTKIKENAGVAFLYQPDKGMYTELTLGLENFRLGPIPLFTLDYSFSFDKKGFRDHGIIIKLSSLLNN